MVGACRIVYSRNVMHHSMRSIIFCISIAMASCVSKNVTEAVVVNESDYYLSSVEIFTAENSVFNKSIALEPEERNSYEILMPDTPKVDGDYIIEFEQNGKEEAYRFGYYTNGYPLFKYKIFIENDTIIIEEGDKEY